MSRQQQQQQQYQQYQRSIMNYTSRQLNEENSSSRRLQSLATIASSFLFLEIQHEQQQQLQQQRLRQQQQQQHEQQLSNYDNDSHVHHNASVNHYNNNNNDNENNKENAHAIATSSMKNHHQSSTNRVLYEQQQQHQTTYNNTNHRSYYFAYPSSTAAITYPTYPITNVQQSTCYCINDNIYIEQEGEEKKEDNEEHWIHSKRCDVEDNEDKGEDDDEYENKEENENDHESKGDGNEEEEEEDDDKNENYNTMLSTDFANGIGHKNDDDDDSKVGEDVPYYMKSTWRPTIPTFMGGCMNRITTNKKRIATQQQQQQHDGIEPQQVTPDMIRKALKEYIQNHPEKKKTKLLYDLGVNSNSYRKFMNRDNYKDPWRAVENGTYWAAARYLEAEHVHPNRRNTSVVIPKSSVHAEQKGQEIIHNNNVENCNRQTNNDDKVTSKNHLSSKTKTSSAYTKHATRSSESTNYILAEHNVNDKSDNIEKQNYHVSNSIIDTVTKKGYQASCRDAAIQYMNNINKCDCDDCDDTIISRTLQQHGIENIFTTTIYQNIVQQVKMFLNIPGVSKSNFCLIALDHFNRKALDKFILKRNKSYQSRDTEICSTLEILLTRLWVFFEKKRIYDGMNKIKDKITGLDNADDNKSTQSSCDEATNLVDHCEKQPSTLALSKCFKELSRSVTNQTYLSMFTPNNRKRPASTLEIVEI